MSAKRKTKNGKTAHATEVVAPSKKARNSAPPQALTPVSMSTPSAVPAVEEMPLDAIETPSGAVPVAAVSSIVADAPSPLDSIGEVAVDSSDDPGNAGPVLEVTPREPALEPASAPALTAPLSAEARHALIAELAYLRAQQIGFGRTNPVEDWVWAEAEVARRYGQAQSRAA